LGRGRDFRSLLRKGKIIVAPGATDAWVAKIIEGAGFKTVYVTGAGVANTLIGIPDLGLVTMTEMVEKASSITDSVSVPVISDADTGYGNALNVRRTVQEFERAGVAGIHIEDQVFPKKCGHFQGKSVIPCEEMVKKIEAAIDARKDPDFVIIARTDSRSVEGIHKAIDRGRAYAKAGADMVFVEAPQSRRELELIAKSIDVPLVANMVEGGKTPLVRAEELERMGYGMVLWANLALRVAAKALQDAMSVLKREGTSESIIDRMITWDERQRIVGLPEFQKLDKKYA